MYTVLLAKLVAVRTEAELIHIATMQTHTHVTKTFFFKEIC